MSDWRIKHDDSECDCEGDTEDKLDWHDYLLFENAEDELGGMASAQIKAGLEAVEALRVGLSLVNAA